MTEWLNNNNLILSQHPCHLAKAADMNPLWHSKTQKGSVLPQQWRPRISAETKMLHPECSVLPSAPRYLTEVNSRAGHRTDTGYLMCSSRVLSTSCGSLNPPRNLWDQLFCHFTDRKLEKQRNLPYAPVNWKKKKNARLQSWELHFIWQTCWGLKPKGSLLHHSERSLQRDKEGVKRHPAVFAKKLVDQVDRPSKDYC